MGKLQTAQAKVGNNNNNTNNNNNNYFFMLSTFLCYLMEIFTKTL